MINLLRLTGRLTGGAGLLIAVLAVLARLAGRHWLAGFETLTLLQAGIAGMVAGCFCLLLVLTDSTGHS